MYVCLVYVHVSGNKQCRVRQAAEGAINGAAQVSKAAGAGAGNKSLSVT